MLCLGSRMKALLLNASLPEFLGADQKGVEIGIDFWGVTSPGSQSALRD